MDGYIQTIPLFDRNELIELMSHLSHDITGWEPATILDPDNPIDTQIRKTNIHNLRDDCKSADIITNKLNEAVAQYAQSFRHLYGDDVVLKPMITHHGSQYKRQGLQLLHYVPDDFYRWHVDEDRCGDEQASKRVISVVLYLRSASKGGGTEFIHKSFHPKMGEVLIFPSTWTYVHRAQPVIEGEKIVCVTWFEVY
jgi:hypothetical protein